MLRNSEVTRIVVETDVMMRRSGPASLRETYSPKIILRVGDDEVWIRPRVLNACETVQEAFDRADQYCLEQIGAQITDVKHVPPDDVARSLKLQRRMRLERQKRTVPQYGVELRRLQQ
jgi:hypothetical protein